VKIRFSRSARDRFLATLERIPKDDPPAAARFRARVERVLRRLGPHPSSGRSIPEFSDLPHREVIVAPLRFFSRVDAKVVWIEAVWHGAQQPRPPAGRPPKR